MGTAIDQLDMIASLCTEGHLPFGARIADIGCQQLWGGNVEGILRFLKAFGCDDLDSSVVEGFAKNGAFIGHCLRTVGFDYTSFDVVDAPFCRFLDLESDATPNPGAFDLVLNFGTTEHVLNQFNALRILHELAKPGGLIYSYFIRGGQMDHGLVHYSNRFVDLWMRFNQYEQIWRQDYDGKGNECTWVVARKSREGPFRRVIDVQEGEGLPQLAKPSDRGTDGATPDDSMLSNLLLQFEQQLHAAEQELDAKKLLVQQLEQQLRAAGQETDAKKLLVQQLEQQLRAAEQETGAKRLLVQQLEQQLRAAEQETDAKKRLVQQLEQQLRAAEEEADAKKLLVQQLEQQLRAAEQEGDALRRSNSWRVTAPLRKVARFLRFNQRA
jgi:hypothetical protein